MEAADGVSVASTPDIHLASKDTTRCVLHDSLADRYVVFDMIHIKLLSLPACVRCYLLIFCLPSVGSLLAI